MGYPDVTPMDPTVESKESAMQATAKADFVTFHAYGSEAHLDKLKSRMNRTNGVLWMGHLGYEEREATHAGMIRAGFKDSGSFLHCMGDFDYTTLPAAEVHGSAEEIGRIKDVVKANSA